MFLQGDLQSVFDALYYLGVIDPVLEKDWAKEIDEISRHQQKMENILAAANRYQGDVNALMKELKTFDEKSLSFLAMEVAREFADYHTCQLVH